MLLLMYRSFTTPAKDVTRKDKAKATAFNVKAKTSKGKAKNKGKAGILWPEAKAKVNTSKGKAKTQVSGHRSDPDLDSDPKARRFLCDSGTRLSVRP